MAVQFSAGHAGLKDAIEVVRVYGDNSFHSRRVDRQTAEWCVDVAFERGADPEGNDRNAMYRAHTHRLGDFVRRFRKHDCVRGLVGYLGKLVAVLDSDGFG